MGDLEIGMHNEEIDRELRVEELLVSGNGDQRHAGRDAEQKDRDSHLPHSARIKLAVSVEAIMLGAPLDVGRPPPSARNDQEAGKSKKIDALENRGEAELEHPQDTAG